MAIVFESQAAPQSDVGPLNVVVVDDERDSSGHAKESRAATPASVPADTAAAAPGVASGSRPESVASVSTRDEPSAKEEELIGVASGATEDNA